MFKKKVKNNMSRLQGQVFVSHFPFIFTLYQKTDFLISGQAVDEVSRSTVYSSLSGKNTIFLPTPAGEYDTLPLSKKIIHEIHSGKNICEDSHDISPNLLGKSMVIEGENLVYKIINYESSGYSSLEDWFKDKYNKEYVVMGSDGIELRK